MAAYLYGDLEVTDPGPYEEYRRRAPEIVAAYGGAYLVKGAQPNILEGDAPVRRQVIVAFPDMERLLAFYNSPEYAPLKALRLSCAIGTVAALPGV